MPLDDLLARIRSGVRAGPPVVLATAEPSPPDAVAQWARETGWRRGTHISPPATVLARLCAAWCAERGWAVEPNHIQTGAGLVGAGYVHLQRKGVRGYGLAREVADELWARVALLGLEVPTERRVTKRWNQDKRKPRPLMSEAHGRAVLDSTLRVYPSAKVAASLVGCAAPSISAACHRDVPCAGFLWRHMTLEEVASLPPGTRAGERLRSLRW